MGLFSWFKSKKKKKYEDEDAPEDDYEEEEEEEEEEPKSKRGGTKGKNKTNKAGGPELLGIVNKSLADKKPKKQEEQKSKPQKKPLKAAKGLEAPNGSEFCTFCK
jgi:hypothetical protein